MKTDYFLTWTFVNPTFRCNRRCEFCFSWRGMNDDILRDMDDDFIDYTFGEWLPNILTKHNVKRNSTIMLGGEPFLVLNKVRRIFDVFRDNKPSKLEYQFDTIFSNCDLIDTIDLGLLDDVYMFFHITDLDFEEIDRRVRILLTKTNIHNLTMPCVLNDLNLDRCVDIVKYAVPKRIRVRFTPWDEQGLNIEYKTKLIYKMLECIDVMNDLFDQGYEPRLSAFFHHMLPWWDKEKSPMIVCGRSCIVIDPNGQIRRCVRNLNSVQGMVKDIDDPYEMQYPEIPNRWAYKYSDPECASCEVRKVCQGGCRNDRLLAWGNMDGKSPFCDVYKQVLPPLIQLANKIKASGRKYEDF